MFSRKETGNWFWGVGKVGTQVTCRFINRMAFVNGSAYRTETGFFPLPKCPPPTRRTVRFIFNERKARIQWPTYLGELLFVVIQG